MRHGMKGHVAVLHGGSADARQGHTSPCGRPGGAMWHEVLELVIDGPTG